MRRNTLKFLALTGAVAFGFALSNDASAQVEIVNAKLITSSAITSNDVSDMDFGTWFINFVAGTPFLSLTNDNTHVASALTPGTSVLTNITQSATEGVVTVQTPSPSSLTMTRSATNNFATAGLSLATVSYRTASQNGNINADAATGTVTVLAGLTDETVRFGGTIAVTADPPDATHTADFTVTFSY